MKAKLFIITGSQASGKSTLKKNLISIKSERLKIYDFDSIVRYNEQMKIGWGASVQWRLNATRFWIEKALKNSEDNASSVICGQISAREVEKVTRDMIMPAIFYGFIEVNKDIIEKRLLKRGHNGGSIKLNHLWTEELKSEILERKLHTIFDASNKTEKETGEFFANWILNKINES